MVRKDVLLEKLCRKPMPKNYTTRELDALMSKCNCSKFEGGRGSSIGYLHKESRGVIPHRRSELYGYRIKSH